MFVLNAVDGCIPSDPRQPGRARPVIEEERRFHAASLVLSRRQAISLHLLLPQRFYTHSQRAQGDRHVYASRTRFIPREILDHFDYVSWPGSAASTASAGRTGPRLDVAAQMRRMWK